MYNNLTELVFILDRSGSMAGLESDTIGGFNAMLEKQKAEPGECLVSTVLFDNTSRVLHDRVPLERVRPLTRDDYTVGGCTALLDAIGGAVHHIETIHRYARPEDVPERTLFIITTDGMENASRRFSADEVRRMIRRKEEGGKWEFLFIGANIDALETAASMGISRSRAVNYNADSVGTHVVFESISQPISAARANRPLGSDWRERIDRDHKTRKQSR